MNRPSTSTGSCVLFCEEEGDAEDQIDDDAAMRVVHIFFKRLYPGSEQFLYLAIDEYSRYAFGSYASTANSETLEYLVEELYRERGIKKIVWEWSTEEIVSDAIREMFVPHETRLVRWTKHSPEIGSVARVLRSLIRSQFREGMTDLDKEAVVEQVLEVYNLTYQPLVKAQPEQLLYGVRRTDELYLEDHPVETQVWDYEDWINSTEADSEAQNDQSIPGAEGQMQDDQWNGVRIIFDRIDIQDYVHTVTDSEEEETDSAPVKGPLSPSKGD